jgi:hypothetical protein
MLLVRRSLNKIRRFQFVAVLVLVGTATSFSQNWQNVGGGTKPQYLRQFFVDTSNNLLYAAGGFTMAGPIPVCYSATWNGVVWDSIPGICPWGGVNFQKFNGEVYMNCVDSIRKWNGTSWINICSMTTGNGVLNLFSDNNFLYALGAFDTINGVPASRIAKYNGSTWSSIDTTKWYGGMTKAIRFQNKLYVLGNFSNYNGSIDDLAMWDGLQWQSVGGFNSGFSSLSCFAIYNSELWIGGRFNFLFYKDVLRWDGVQWLDPGGYANPPAAVQCMAVYNNELWAGGNFASFNGMPAQYLTRWNGTDWCLTYDTIGGSVEDMAVFNNELYIGGGFNLINGDTMGYIAKWIGGNNSDTCGNTTGLPEIGKQHVSFSLHPNPVTENLQIEVHNNNGESHTLILTSALGARVLNAEFTLNQTSIDVSFLNKGIYLLQICNKDGSICHSEKFIKE